MIEIFNEIISNYSIRYNDTEKDNFLRYIAQFCNKNNLNYHFETKRHNKNVVFGDISNAYLIIGAHYDTPNKNTKNNKIFLTDNYSIKCKEFFLNFFCFITNKFVANENNFNDNTSGVLAVLYLLEIVKNNKVAFVLFDNEENNLKGSKMFYKLHKKALQNQLIINLDCIGVGDNIGLLYYYKFNKLYVDMLENNFMNTNHFNKIVNNNYVTDSKSFTKAITISSFYKNTKSYFYENIHTAYDTQINLLNIKIICENINNFIIEKIKEK